MHFLTLYANTDENAVSVGWNRVPELCQGNYASEFVIHDLAKGLFYFVDAALRVPASKSVTKAPPKNPEPVSSPKIEAVEMGGYYRTGTLANIMAKDICNLLGFLPNVQDATRGKYIWSFTVDGEWCAVWDYKGSYLDKVFSTYGPAYALRKVFGEKYQDD
jgi:hypothetical protein